jgi:hypothetical protein
MADTPETETPEMALALYASTAATLAVKALQGAGVLKGETVHKLVTTLVACRDIAGANPSIELHCEGLLDMLLNDPTAE